jgi:hypothetical protein
MKNPTRLIALPCILILVFSTQPPKQMEAQEDFSLQPKDVSLQAPAKDSTSFEVLEDVQETCKKLQEETTDQLILLQIQQGEILEQKAKLDTLSL